MLELSSTEIMEYIYKLDDDYLSSAYIEDAIMTTRESLLLKNSLGYHLDKNLNRVHYDKPVSEVEKELREDYKEALAKWIGLDGYVQSLFFRSQEYAKQYDCDMDVWLHAWVKRSNLNSYFELRFLVDRQLRGDFSPQLQMRKSSSMKLRAQLNKLLRIILAQEVGNGAYRGLTGVVNHLLDIAEYTLFVLHRGSLCIDYDRAMEYRKVYPRVRTIMQGETDAEN